MKHNYIFKTKKELLIEFGENWRRICNINYHMEYLLGTEFHTDQLGGYLEDVNTVMKYNTDDLGNIINIIFIKNTNVNNNIVFWAISPSLIKLNNVPQYKSLKLNYEM